MNFNVLTEKEKEDFYPRGQLFKWGRDVYILTVIPQNGWLPEGESAPVFSPWLVALICLETGNRLCQPSIQMVRNHDQGEYQSLDESCLWVSKKSSVFQFEGLTPIDDDVKTHLFKALFVLDSI